MYSFASWDGTVGGLCLKCVCVCLLEPLQRQSESQSGNNLVVQFLPVDLGFLNLRQLWEKTLWSWCLAHVFSSGWRVLRVGRNRFRKSRDVSSCLSGHNKDMTKPQVFGHFPNPIRSIFVRGFPHFSLRSHRQFDPSPMVCVQCTEFAPREAKKLHQLKILCCLWLAKNGRCRGSGVTENECISKEIPRGGSGMKVGPP